MFLCDKPGFLFTCSQGWLIPAGDKNLMENTDFQRNTDSVQSDDDSTLLFRDAFTSVVGNMQRGYH